jgi:repressor LexA
VIELTTNYSNLTSKQKKVFSVIEAYIKSKGIPPTVREIGEMIGEKTPGAVQGILNRLEQKGVIKRQLGMARSIQLATDNTLYSGTVHVPELKRINQRNLDDLINVYNISKYHSISSEFISPEENSFIFERPGLGSETQTPGKATELLFVSIAADIKEGESVLVQYENHTLLREFHMPDQQDMVLLEGNDGIVEKESFNKDEIKIIGKVTAKFIKYN